MGGAAVAYLADRLAGRGGDHRDDRRVGRLLRGRLRHRGALELPRRTTTGAGRHACVVANLLALRSVAVEFGPAELIDSLADPAASPTTSDR